MKGKRYKVVQDANGIWGVVDMLRVLDGRLNLAFAGWDGCAGYRWIDEIAHWAIRLNRKGSDRSALHWSRYTPREGS